MDAGFIKGGPSASMTFTLEALVGETPAKQFAHLLDVLFVKSHDEERSQTVEVATCTH